MSKNYLSIYAKSFNWAGFFLPRVNYNNCSNLYDFCRTVDNIVDDEINLDIKKKNFREFKKKFFEKDFSSDKIKKMWNLIDQFSISIKIVEDLFDGVETDLNEKVKLKTKKELLIYSYRVAGTVGLMMAKILKVNSDKEIPISCRFAILVARRVYRQIGNEIKKKRDFEEYKNSGKIFVTKFGKVKETLLSIYDFIILIFLNPSDSKVGLRHDEIKKEIKLNERF